MSPNKPASEMREAVSSLRPYFVRAAWFSVIASVLVLAPSGYMLEVYGRVVNSRNHMTLIMLTVAVLGAYVLMEMLEWARSEVMREASVALDEKMTARLFGAIFDANLRRIPGGTQQPMNDFRTVRDFLYSPACLAVMEAPVALVMMVLLFLISPVLGWSAVVFGVLQALVAWLNERSTKPPLMAANRSAIAAQQYADGTLRNAEVIESMGMLRAIQQRWQQRQNAALALQGEASDRATDVAALTRFVRMAAQSGVLGLGALLVIEHQMTPGGMIAASILLGRALAPVDAVIGHWRSLVQARGAYSRLDELLRAHPEPEPRTALPRPQGFVTVENLVAGPPGARAPVLKGIKFGATAGMLVAIIGPSASGKSTLARALVGVWPPLSGTVRLDGADVAQWSKDELGPWLGYLPQDVELFEGTVAENIARFGPPDATRTVAAAQRAGVHDMILRLPQGYETPIGEGGMALSGGQRQRIGLARAMYGDPALVVLDEPNANLDEAGDAALVGALRVMKEEKRTVFVVTHRMNLLAEADAILVLTNGTIQAYGPRDAVLDTLRLPRKPAATNHEAQLPREAQA